MTRYLALLCVFVCVASAQDEISSTSATNNSTVTSPTSRTSVTTDSSTTNSSTTTSSTAAAILISSSSSSAEVDASSSSASPVPLALPSSTEAADNSKKYLTADDLPTCTQSNLSDCVKRLFDILLPRYRNGSKELNIPPLDPFVLNRTTFQYANGAVSGRITMRQAQVVGFAQLTHKSMDVKVDKDKVKLRAVSHVPQLRIAGNYKADLAFNNVRLRPRGTFNVTLLDVTMDNKAEGTFYNKDGHRFVHMTKSDVEPKIGDLKIQANGIFPDQTLNDLVLNVANQYWREIYRVMLPETRRYWAPLLLRIINEAMTRVPYDYFVKEE